MSGTTSKIEMEWLKEEEEGKAITYKNRFSDFVPSSYLRRIESFLKKKNKKKKAKRMDISYLYIFCIVLAKIKKTFCFLFSFGLFL